MWCLDFIQVTKCMIDDTAPRQVTLATSEGSEATSLFSFVSPWVEMVSIHSGQGTCPAILGCEICLCPDQNGIHKDQKRYLWLCIRLKQSLHIQSVVLSFARTCVCKRIKATAMWHGLLQSWNSIVERIAVPRAPSCVGCRQHAKSSCNMLQQSSVTTQSAKNP